MRFWLRVEYDGTEYCGWQVQSGGESVQGRLEASLQQLLGHPVRLKAAGRTDAGVHACGQIAAFDTQRAWTGQELKRALNAILPRDIVVREAAHAPDSFDPRKEALLRVYEYRILNRELRSAFDHRLHWHIREPLDLQAMMDSAMVFLGTHDFAAFRALGTPVKSTVRHIYLSQWRRSGPLLVYRVEGSSFLRHMVRTMVATMVEAGRHRLSITAVKDLLFGADRSKTPAAAPSSGLFLVEVRYRLGWESRIR